MSRLIQADSDLDTIAAQWIARRDHGLTDGEKSRLDAWLTDPRHAEAFSRCEAMWGALPKLKKLPSRELDALMVPKQKRRAPIIWLTTATAAAAAIAILILIPDRYDVPRAVSVVQTHTAPPDAEARIALPDGSVAVLHRGSQIAFGQFASGRQVRLLSGEAHFTVSKTSTVPFFVRAGQITIRDIGTAFNVRLDPERVAVLVTDGSVVVRNIAAGARNISRADGSTDSAAPEARLTIGNQPGVEESGEFVLTVGQQAVIETARAVPVLEVHAPAQFEVEQALAWKSRRVSFDRTSLADAVQELNRYNVRQLRIADPEISSVLLAGGVQSDNLDAFVRLLDSGFGVTAELRGDEIVLRKTR